MTNVEIVRAFYNTSARGDIDGMTSLLSPDIAWTEMAGFPYGGTYNGIEALMTGVFERLGSEWEDFTVTPDTFYDAGDTVIVTGYYSGTYKKTGKMFRARVSHIWHVSHGLIDAFEQFVDTVLVDRAVNLRD